MKKLLSILLTLCLLMACAAAEDAETAITLGETILVNGTAITEDAAAPVYLAHKVETHPGVAEALKDVSNRVVTITAAGTYRISGTATDAQIAVCAGAEDHITLILDGIDITCRTAPAIAVFTAKDPRVAGEYAVTLVLAEGSENVVTGSHTKRIVETDVKMDGAISSLVSLGIEGSGVLRVDADNEGIEVKYGHLTINGGKLNIQAGDDPINVSEDNVGVLTMNAGYVFSAVKNIAGGEGDGIDSNGYIVFNGGTAINLAHPTSMDSGIDSDMGSRINGGVIVGAGNMYDPIEADSEQLFMMLEFAESTDDLLVVTDAAGDPIFAYDFPYDYMYIAFSTPDLKEGETYHVYLGGEIVGEEENGLYTTITSYTPGTQLMHGEGNAAQRVNMQMPADMPQGDFDPNQGQPGQPDQQPQGQPGRGGDDFGSFGGQASNPMEALTQAASALDALDLNEILKGTDLNELLKDVDLNKLLTGLSISDVLTAEQIQQYLGDADIAALEAALHVNSALGSMQGMGGFGGGFGGGMRGLTSSADVATTEFTLTRETTGFTNVSAVGQ